MSGKKPEPGQVKELILANPKASVEEIIKKGSSAGIAVSERTVKRIQTMLKGGKKSKKKVKTTKAKETSKPKRKYKKRKKLEQAPPVFVSPDDLSTALQDMEKRLSAAKDKQKNLNVEMLKDIVLVLVKSL